MCRKLVALVLILAFAGAASADLVAHYTFNDGTANNQGGTAGAAANGSMEGDAVIVCDDGGALFPWDPDKGASPVLDLTANSNPWVNLAYVNCGGGGGGWGPQSIVTVAAWYKPTGDAAVENFGGIVTKGTGENGAWALENYGTNGDIGWNAMSCPTWMGLPSGNGDTFDGSWHHAVGQWRGEGDYGSGWEQATSQIYVDGVLWATAHRWGNLSGNDLDVIIGCEAGTINGGNVWRNWEGYIDDVQIYDEFLDAAAILDIYEEGFLDDPCIPEPATIALLGLGGLALLRKKR